MAYASAGLSSNIGTRGTSFSLDIDISKLETLGKDTRIKLRSAISKTTLDIQAEVVRIIREKNLIDTGNLLNSIQSVMDLDGLTGYILVGAYYGIYLEFGTIKMGPRPFMGPAFERIGPSFIANVTKAIQEAIEGK